MIEDGKTYKLFFGPPVFAAEVIKKADFVTLAVEQERIRGVFVVKAGSTLKSVQDIAPNTRVAMPSPAAASAKAWPRASSAKLLLAILALASLQQQEIV